MLSDDRRLPAGFSAKEVNDTCSPFAIFHKVVIVGLEEPFQFARACLC